jgi:hypothetical protein
MAGKGSEEGGFNLDSDEYRSREQGLPVQHISNGV